MVDVLLNQPDQEIFTALLSKVANRHTLPPLTRHNHLETFVEGLRCAIHCTKGQDQAQTLVHGGSLSQKATGTSLCQPSAVLPTYCQTEFSGGRNSFYAHITDEETEASSN